MQKNRIGNQKTWNRLGTIAMAGLLIAVMFASLIPAVEAKTQITFGGHSAVRYNPYEIPSNLRLYVYYVEYDTVYGWGSNDYGVRLYLTPLGQQTLKNNAQLLTSATLYVMGNPEWYAERSFNSVGTEIWYHSTWGKRLIQNLTNN